MTKDLSICPRKIGAVVFLNSGTLAWFFLLQLNLPDIFNLVTINDPTWPYNIGPLLFFGSAIFWSLSGSFFGLRVNGRKLLFAWIILGTLSTILLTLFQGTFFATIASLLLGMSLGLGLPSSFALIANFTTIEDRARVSGAIILGTFVLAFLTLATARMLNLGIAGTILLFAAIRLTSLLALVLNKCEPQKQESDEITFSNRTNFKEFGFYLFPWVMFVIAAGLAWNLIPQTEEFANSLNLGFTLRYITIAVFGLVAGIVADRFGRKIPIIAGLITLGASFALLGFFGITQTNLILYLAISGVAWGSFFVIFLAVPGDLSVHGSREKFYAIGYILPIAIFFSLSSLPGSSILADFPASSFSQILSIIVLVSIIPVLRAKETLSTQKIRERKMKEHLNKIRELMQESKKKDD